MTTPDPSADLREAARIARKWREHIYGDDGYSALADRLERLADTLPLRDAVIDAAVAWREADLAGAAKAHNVIAHMNAVDALRAANTGEGH